jgi:hypothetical protein
MTRFRIVFATLAAVLGASVAACSTPHPTISNGSTSACYRAIPTATHAVHVKGAKLVGVHRSSTERIRQKLPPTAQGQLNPEMDTTVCAVVFRGTFKPGDVDQAQPGAAGSYAIVLVTSGKLQLLTSFVVPKLPPTLGRRLA